jgi:hypothetical protein
MACDDYLYSRPKEENSKTLVQTRLVIFWDSALFLSILLLMPACFLSCVAPPGDLVCFDYLLREKEKFPWF